MSKNKDKSNGKDFSGLQKKDMDIRVGINYDDHLVVIGIWNIGESIKSVPIQIRLSPDEAVILAAQINQQAGYLKTNK